MREISEERGPVHLALVLHFHQPVGNFGDVFTRVTELCYRPLMQLLDRYPAIKTHLHFNGILLDWFERHEPDLIELIQGQVDRGSVELLTGGQQEPVLTVLPEVDAVGQVRALTDELQRRFGAAAQGAWLTERVWEPNLPMRLSKAGVRYIALDDTILQWAGVENEQLLGYSVTEDAGWPIALFPGSKALRYTIPFRPHDETFALLDRVRRVGKAPPLMVYADDAEKFGEWPGTYEWVFDQGWLEGFFDRLQRESWVRTVHLSEELASRPPEARVYPPTSSYQEMTVWALPTPARTRMEHLLEELEKNDPLGAKPFVRGGHWRGFLGKYPEVNRLHKRMLRVSRRVHAAEKQHGDKALWRQALRDLYRGQCNDAYWHGSFGGLYLGHLRRAVETYLIRAERSIDRLERGEEGWSRVESFDFDADFQDEFELRNSHAHVVVDPVDGGTIVAWDLRRAAENLVTVLQRHEESFHEALREGRAVYLDEEGNEKRESDGAPTHSESGESHGDDDGIATIHGVIRVKPGVEPKDLQIDRHPRVAGMEWKAAVDVDASDPLHFPDIAQRLDGAWQSIDAGSAERVVLRREGDGCRVEKSIALSADSAALETTLVGETLEGGEPWRLATEWNLLVGYTGDDLEVLEHDGAHPAPRGWQQNVTSLRFRGGGDRTLTLECSPAAIVSWAPVHTVSSSEAGLEKIGQGTCFLVSWRVDDRLDAQLRLTPTAPALDDEPII